MVNLWFSSKVCTAPIRGSKTYFSLGYPCFSAKLEKIKLLQSVFPKKSCLHVFVFFIYIFFSFFLLLILVKSIILR